MSAEVNELVREELARLRKKVASAGGKARARKYDAATLSKWSKLGGRPKKYKTQAKRGGL